MSDSNLDVLARKIAIWAHDRKIPGNSTAVAQLAKLMEEHGELAAAICRLPKGEPSQEDLVPLKDAVGDMTVVLIVICEVLGITYSHCVAMAYEEIKDRRGVMVDGVFIKEEAA